jgi:hypothetical protein
MAGLKRKKPAPWTVEKIKAGLIVNRLEKHIFAPATVLLYPDDPKADPVSVPNPDLMQQSQVTAALGLLKKVHPDLAAQQVDVSGDVSIRVLKVDSNRSPSE